MKIKSVNELAATLRPDAVKSLHERRLVVRTALGAPLVILWPAAIGAVQVTQLTPLVLPPEEQTEMTLFLARLNASLEMPGFSLDPTTGQVAFRAPVLLDMEGAVHLDHLQHVVLACQAAVAEHLPALSAFAAGQSGLSSVRV